MNRPKIIRLYGTADFLVVEFKNVGGTEWKCSVPPDMKDGSYVCHFTAVNEYGEQADWIGELFMCNGVCHINFDMPKYLFWYSDNDCTFSLYEDITFELEECEHDN